MGDPLSQTVWLHSRRPIMIDCPEAVREDPLAHQKGRHHMYQLVLDLLQPLGHEGDQAHVKPQ